MSEERSNAIQMLETSHQIVATTTDVVTALQNGEKVSTETIIHVLNVNKVAYTALLEHHLKIIDMLEALIINIEARTEEEPVAE